jgi:hypothetical protein
MSARQELAAAACTVAYEVDGEPVYLDVVDYYRQSARPGTGFVRLADKNRAGNGFGFIDTWVVLITLPQDVAAAEKFIEQIAEPLLTALDPVMHVQSLTPTQIVFDAQSVNGVVITGAREG